MEATKRMAADEGYWHLCTPGELQGIIFKEKEDYIFGMNLSALCAGLYSNSISILTFQLMSNHIHYIMHGKRDFVIEFFLEFKRRLKKYLALKNDYETLKKFNPNVIKISDINYLRNAIAYVNRNGYLVDRKCTPFTYPWGANRYFFNYTSNEILRTSISRISIKKRRKIFHTHTNELPDNYFITDGYVSPESYVKIEEAMQLYRDSHHYFNLISRRTETFSQIAKELGDSITYTDEEIYTAIFSLSIKNFEMPPKALSPDQKIEIAKELHFNYNATNKQIARTIRIDERIINNLFPDNKK